jgi:hypothetical protein
MPGKPSLQEWLEIYSDLDAYIARGGKLWALTLPDKAFLSPTLVAFINDQLGEATRARLGHFFSCLGAASANRAPLTEEQLQAIWHATADDAAQSSH